MVDTRLFLPQEWVKDKQRREKAGVPKQVRYRTRHQLCWEMLERHGETLPHAWITGDDEMGRPYWFRRRLHALAEQYLLCWSSDFCAARVLMEMAPDFMIPCFPSIKTRHSGRTR